MTLGKISKICPTRCQILRLKCTKFDFHWGSAPDPAGGAYSAPANRCLYLRGRTSKGRGRRRESRMGKVRETRGWEGMKVEREEKLKWISPSSSILVLPLTPTFKNLASSLTLVVGKVGTGLNC